MFGLFKKKRKMQLTNFVDEDNKTISLLEINGRERDNLVEYFTQLCVNGSEFSDNSGTISSKSILSLVGCAGASAGGSAALSSQLFIATANPASLMQIGSGVGSAVMGTGGIVGQAAFLPAAGAVLPIALPVIALQTMSTIVVLKQFNIVNKKLDVLDKNIRKILQRDEASFAGEILFATKQLDVLEEQFKISKKFSSEMVTNLCLLQSKIGPAFERYRILYESEKIDAKSQNEGRKQKHCDSHFLVAFSILELRVDTLKMKLAAQESPEQLRFLVKIFGEKSNDYKKLWAKIKNDPKLTKNVSEDLKNAIKEMNIWQKHMPSWLFGKKGERKKKENLANELDSHADNIQGSLDSIIDVGNNFTSMPGTDNTVSLIYWKDQNGTENSFYITDLDKILEKTKKAS